MSSSSSTGLPAAPTGLRLVDDGGHRVVGDEHPLDAGDRGLVVGRLGEPEEVDLDRPAMPREDGDAQAVLGGRARCEGSQRRPELRDVRAVQEHGQRLSAEAVQPHPEVRGERRIGVDQRAAAVGDAQPDGDQGRHLSAPTALGVVLQEQLGDLLLLEAHLLLGNQELLVRHLDLRELGDDPFHRRPLVRRRPLHVGQRVEQLGDRHRG
jgi:hypothetical protein